MRAVRSPVVKVIACAALAAAVLVEPRAAPSAPSLRDVLKRAGAYVVRYGESLATVVADEDYTQRVVSDSSEPGAERVLHSEIAFVKLADSTEWQGFRDVLTVDGNPVPGAGGRLERVLRDAPAAVLPQVRRLAAESARYNLGSLVRDFNVPTTVLQFVHPEHQDRFRFSRKREEIAGSPEGLDRNVWLVEFRERERGTMIRDLDGRDVPVNGQLWIAPADGRIVRSMFRADAFKAEIAVTWGHDTHLDLWVPTEMRERYEDRSGATIIGNARYSNYRRFDVTVRIR
jgi:hypothetical protein